jgi:hypothetical protein
MKKVIILVQVSDHRQELYEIGEVCQLPDDLAGRWVEAGWAQLVSDDPEAATLEPEENAAMPRARKRG